MKIGFRIDWGLRRLVIGIDPEHFYWTPGEIESGSSYPATLFEDAISDKYWLWGWLGFTIFYSRGHMA